VTFSRRRTGFIAGVVSIVDLAQEALKFVAIEPRPTAIQAGQEFKFAGCDYRHGERRYSENLVAQTGYILPMPAKLLPL
jgi:hypothetical protein